MEGAEYMGESVRWLKPTPALRWVKYWAGRKYELRLEQRYLNKDGGEEWREIPTILAPDQNN